MLTFSFSVYLYNNVIYYFYSSKVSHYCGACYVSFARRLPSVICILLFIEYVFVQIMMMMMTTMINGLRIFITQPSQIALRKLTAHSLVCQSVRLSVLRSRSTLYVGRDRPERF